MLTVKSDSYRLLPTRIHSDGRYLFAPETYLVYPKETMLRLASYRRMLLLLLFSALLLSVPVFAQDKPQAAPEKVVTAEIMTTASLPQFAPDQNAQTQEKTPAVSDEVLASKNKPLAKEEKPVVASGDDMTSSAVSAAPQQPAQGGEGDALRKAAQNPIASLISVPIQNVTSFNIGPTDRIQNVINIQPVIPLKLNENWNLILRIITPIISQPTGPDSDQTAFGFGDINPAFFFSPSKPGKLIWGAGPTVVFPTAASRSLGQGKLSLGPTFVGLVQQGKWTVGVLANNVWSVAGKDDRAAVNQMVLQYFINYNLKKGYYITIQPTNTANWRASGDDRWVVPLGGGIGRIMKLGFQPVNISLQFYANVVRPPDSSPFKVQFQIAFLYPKKPKEKP